MCVSLWNLLQMSRSRAYRQTTVLISIRFFFKVEIFGKLLQTIYIKYMLKFELKKK